MDKDDELLKTLRKLARANIGDKELIHVLMDEALCTVLKEAGFTRSVEFFKQQPKWYA